MYEIHYKIVPPPPRLVGLVGLVWTAPCKTLWYTRRYALLLYVSRRLLAGRRPGGFAVDRGNASNNRRSDSALAYTRAQTEGNKINDNIIMYIITDSEPAASRGPRCVTHFIGTGRGSPTTRSAGARTLSLKRKNYLYAYTWANKLPPWPSLSTPLPPTTR